MARPMGGTPVNTVEQNGSYIDVEPTFCYFGDMLDAEEGYYTAIAEGYSVAWGK